MGIEVTDEAVARALLAMGVEIPEDDNTERERNAERRHREEIAKALARPDADEPSDYEVWRDALRLAVEEGAHITDGAGDGEGIKQFGSDVLLARAEWFRNELNLGPRAVADAAEFDPFRPDLGDVV